MAVLTSDFWSSVNCSLALASLCSSLVLFSSVRSDPLVINLLLTLMAMSVQFFCGFSAFLASLVLKFSMAVLTSDFWSSVNCSLALASLCSSLVLFSSVRSDPLVINLLLTLMAMSVQFFSAFLTFSCLLEILLAIHSWSSLESSWLILVNLSSILVFCSSFLNLLLANLRVNLIATLLGSSGAFLATEASLFSFLDFFSETLSDWEKVLTKLSFFFSVTISYVWFSEEEAFTSSCLEGMTSKELSFFTWLLSLTL